eukprot:tig00000197_g15685.t1
MATLRQISFCCAIAPLAYYALYVMLVARWHHREVMFNAKYGHSERCVCEEEHFWDESGDRRKWMQHQINDIVPRFIDPDGYTNLNVSGVGFDETCQCVIGGWTDYQSTMHSHRNLGCRAPPFKEVQSLGGIHDAGTALFTVLCKPSCCMRGPKLVYTKQWKKREAEDQAKRQIRIEKDIEQAKKNFEAEEAARLAAADPELVPDGERESDPPASSKGDTTGGDREE